MSEGRLIAKNVSVLTLAQAVSMLAGMGSMFILARVLGPENFGYLGYGMAIMAYFHLAVTFGSDTYGIREIARDRDRAGAIAGQILGPRIIMAILAFGSLLALVYVLDQPQVVKAVMMVQGLTIFAVALAPDYIFAGLERMEANAARQSAQALIVFGSISLLVQTPEHVVLAAMVQSGVALIVALAMVAYARKVTPGFTPTLSKVRHVVKTSAPFAVATMINTIYLTFDIIMLEAMRSKVEVGLYSGAFRVVLIALVPAGIIYAALYPRLAKSVGDTDRMKADAHLMTTALMMVGIPIAVGGVVFSDQIIKVLFGQNFVAAAAPLALLMVNVLVIHFRMSMGGPLSAWDREKFHSMATVFGGVMNVGLNLAWIPSHGMMGAAAASLASQVVVTVLFAGVQYRAVGSIPGGVVLKGLCAGAVAFGVGFLALEANLGHHPLRVLVVAGGASTAAFVAMALALRMVRVRDLMAVVRR